jgi:hypothetical protein
MLRCTECPDLDIKRGVELTQIFRDPITMPNVMTAIAAFETTLITP